MHLAKDDARREVEDFQLKMETEKALIQRHYEEEAIYLESAMTQKRATLAKLVLRLDEAQKTANLLADVLRAPELSPNH